jgi:hypothetical protein
MQENSMDKSAEFVEVGRNVKVSSIEIERTDYIPQTTAKNV